MKIKVIMTGSDGNCVLLQYKNTNVLIDAGFKTQSKMKECLEELMNEFTIDAIIITHEHIDHLSPWTGRLSIAKDIPIYLHKKHMIGEEERKAKRLSYIDRRKSEEHFAKIVEIEENKEFVIKDMTFYPFTSYHDANKTLGFRINNDKLCYITDCGFISNNIKKEAMKCNNLVLEFNYEDDVMMNSERHYSNKWRTLSKFGHLSNQEAINFIKFLQSKGTVIKNIVTLHTSRTNNNYEIIEEKLKEIPNIIYHISQRENNEFVEI